MSHISEKFANLLEEKNIPVKHQEIDNNNHLYRVKFQVQKNRQVVVEIILQESDESYIDAQIVYRHVHMLDNREKEPEALQLINELNGMRTGYYSLYLAGDGEIFLRTLLRVGEDVEPLYQTLIMGSGIIRVLLPDMEEKLGSSARP